MNCIELQMDILRKVSENGVLLRTIMDKLNVSVQPEKTPYEPSLEKYFVETFPISDKLIIINFEKMLTENSDYKIFFVKKFSVVGGMTLKNYVSRLCDTLLSPKGYCAMCWSGTAEKGAIRLLFQVLETLFLAAKTAFPNETEKIMPLIECTIKQKIKNAEAKVKATEAKMLGLPPPRSDYFKEKKNKQIDSGKESGIKQ